MCLDGGWRPLSDAESALLTAIVVGSGVESWLPLLHDLAGARARHDAEWILDIVPTSFAAGDVADGALPVRTLVTGPDGAFRGEILIWIEAGGLSGLEFAWVTDAAPAEWPTPHWLTVVRV